MYDFTLFDNDELFALAAFEFEKDEYQNALPKLKRLIATGTPPVGTYSVLGRLYANLRLFEKAKTALEKYLELLPEVVPEHFQLSMVYLELGDEERATATWEAVLDKAPNFPPALFAKAQYLLRDNQPELAVELFNQIIETASPQDQHVEPAKKLVEEIQAKV